RLMMSFSETDGLKEKTRIVVNRVGLDSGQISLKKAQETIGSEIYWQIPNDYRVMVEVRNNGVPLIEQAPRAGITQAMSGLADVLSGESKKSATGSGKAGLSRWFGFLGSKNQEVDPNPKADEESASK
ncbi:MAG: CpaE family protein, partial [Blastopirellula sp. JB062]